MDRRKKTIAVDFDGVLHSYVSGWQGYEPTDPPVAGAQEFIRNLIAANFQVIVFSVRASEKVGAEAIKRWLIQHDFPEIEVTHTKPNAEVYVDDRAFRFEGNFSHALSVCKDIKAREPWYKSEKHSKEGIA